MTTLSTATQISLVLLGALATVGVVVLLVLLLQVRRLGRELNRQAGPLLERGKVIAANLEYISERVKTDVERLDGSVKAVTDRLNQASDHMEDRIQEFNALMEVVQGEAEGVFLDTAATVRGLRAGAGRLTGGEREPVSHRSRHEGALPPGGGPDVDEEGSVEAEDTRERTA